ncbi:galactitol-1-phosphate 5-dehydrogenase [Oscillospiraceae bacterium MB08-C2-2]|nr:galactitol-1-phosphate 5-dehydrogenase [Oscillospiraceae bacterium MB08-C2-2]
MKAARLHAIGDFRTGSVPTPAPAGEQLLLKVGACGICGSDIPRIFELGTSKQKYPLALGHEFGGEIVGLGEKADPALLGKRGAIFPCIPCRRCAPCLAGDYAMCLDYDYLGSRSDGGFADYCLIPSAWHFVPSHNPDTTDEALSMVEPCTVAQHAIRKAGVSAGYSVLIFGAGPIGIMAARWAKLFGAGTVALVDVAEEKASFARERGQVCINAMTEDVNSAFRALNNGKPADVVIEGTGTAAALNQAIECVRTFGTIAMLGNPHKDTTLHLGSHSNILRKEIHLVGVWNSHYFDLPINEWHFTVRMLDEQKMQVEDLITHRSSLDDLPSLCEDIYNKKVNICKAIYSAEENQ